MTTHRRLRLAMCAIVGAALTVGSLTACGEPDPTITITSLDFLSRSGHFFASTKTGSTFILPAGLPGEIRLTFSSGVQYPSCTLDFDGRTRVTPWSTPIDRSSHLVSKPTAALLASPKITGSLTCVKETAGSVPRSSSFLVWAIPTPMVTMTPSKLSFGSVKVDAKSAPATVTVTSDGSVPAEIASLEYPREYFGVEADGCTGKKLRVGATCTFRIFYAPRADVALPPSTVRIRLGGTAPFGPDGVTMEGSVDHGEGVFTTSSDRLDFGWVAVGTSQPMTLTVTNTGSGPLYISHLTLLWESAIWNTALNRAPPNATLGPYWVAEDGCSGKTLAAAQTCQTRLTFTPVEDTLSGNDAYLVFLVDTTPEWSLESFVVPSVLLSAYKVKLAAHAMTPPQPQPTSEPQPHG